MREHASTAITARRERWGRHADDGQCDYCGQHGPVKDDPFGWKPSCFECWELICFGDEEDA